MMGGTMKQKRVDAPSLADWLNLPLEEVRENVTYDSTTDTVLVAKSFADRIAASQALENLTKSLSDALLPAVKRLNDALVRAESAMNTLRARL